MRDNHDGLPEILDATEQNGHYFALVQLERDGREKRFQFGVSREGYSTLERVRQMRPYGQMPGVPYRYFFVPTVQRLEGDRAIMYVRVEQGRDGKECQTEA